MKIAFFALGIAAAGGLNTPAKADSFLFHVDGEVGDRRAFFAQKTGTNRTPPSIEFKPIEIKELNVAIVYENEQMPELADLNLQFECVAKFNFTGGKVPKTPAWTDPVKMRIAAGSSTLRRIDLKSEDAPSGTWEATSEPVMLKAHKLACNEPEIDNAIRSSVVDGVLKGALFCEKMAALGFTDGVIFSPMSLWSEYIDYTWKTLWPSAKHPDPSGKWSRDSTPEERAEAERKVALAKGQIDELSDKTRRAYEPKLQVMQDSFAFDSSAAKLRGGRKLRDFESRMLQVWQAKSEDDVIAKMGRPHFTDTGKLHLLSYGQKFDNRVTVGNSTGEVWEEGLYTNCDVQFVTMADNGGTYRVADIVLSIDSSNIMATNSSDACGSLLNVPGG